MDTSKDHIISNKMSKEITEQRCEDNTDDIGQIYKIFKKIYLKSPPILKDLTDESVDIDYKESLVDYIDFKKIYNNFKDEKYSSITDAIKDIRLVFLNCYKFYGAKSDHTIKLLEIEEELEQQIDLLDEDLKLFANIQLTLKLLEPYLDRKQKFYFRYPKNCYDSILLRSVAHCRPERLKEYHNILSSKLTTNDNVVTLEGIQHWENKMFFHDSNQYISSMWVLPEIGNFLAIIFKELDYEIVTQGEIERMFLIPVESTTMSKIMTTLLMPIKKPKYIGREMPYKVWSEKLCKKVSEWYKVYHTHKRNKVFTLNSLGINPEFWSILGDENPLIKFDYSNLEYFIKVWIIKGLCDYVINKYKTINNIITNCNERQCTIWKNDMETEEYFYFSSMPDLRIYYYNIPTDEPNFDFLESENIKEETETDDSVSLSGNTYGCTKSLIKPDTSNFKLIADSVQGLRSFLDELDVEDQSIPETLISALEKLIFKMEPQEYNLIMTNNTSKIKLFRDWKLYIDRKEKEKDEILFWEEKEVKSNSKVVNESIIVEKRQRKSVIKKALDFDTYYSDGYISENNNESSMSDFLDSEDDWEAMNRPKLKTKLPVLSSKQKLDELEKQIKNKSEPPLDGDKFDDCQILEKDSTEISVNNWRKRQDLRSNSSETGDDISEQSQVVECIMENNDDVISIKDNDDVISIEDNDDVISIKDNDDIISIEDDDDDNNIDEQIVISDDDIIIDSISHTPSAQFQESSVQVGGYYSSNNNFNPQTTVNSSMRQRASSIRHAAYPIGQKALPMRQVSYPMRQAATSMRQAATPMRQAATPMRQATSPMYNTVSRMHQAGPLRTTSTTMTNLSPNISIIPANVHLPKGIEVSIVKGPQPTITSHFNTTKRPATIRSNGFTKKDPSVVNIECRVISQPNVNGEVVFYVKLPNGELHPVSHALINEYLRNHNNTLPDYWMVPLPVEVAKHFTNV